MISEKPWQIFAIGLRIISLRWKAFHEFHNCQWIKRDSDGETEKKQYAKERN